MTNIDRADARLEITGDAGAGPLVLAAHPADAFGAETVALLGEASGASVVCLNPRGIGASPPGLQSIEEMADDLEAVRLSRRLGELVFWGMSGGVWLGLAYARRHPGALRGLVLESGCASFGARTADPACLLSPLHPAWRAALEARGLIPATLGDDLPARTEWIDVESVGSVFRAVDGPALLVSPGAISDRMRAVMPHLLAFDARPWLGTIVTPTVVIAGDADPILPLHHTRTLAEGLRAELVIVEGGGHVPVTQGRPEVGAAVRRLLATVDGR